MCNRPRFVNARRLSASSLRKDPAPYVLVGNALSSASRVSYFGTRRSRDFNGVVAICTSFCGKRTKAGWRRRCCFRTSIGLEAGCRSVIFVLKKGAPHRSSSPHSRPVRCPLAPRQKGRWSKVMLRFQVARPKEPPSVEKPHQTRKWILIDWLHGVLTWRLSLVQGSAGI